MTGSFGFGGLLSSQLFPNSSSAVATKANFKNCMYLNWVIISCSICFLAFIKQIKSNGILEFFTNTIVEIVRFKLNSLHIPDNSHETRPLLENDTYTDTYSNYTIDQNLNFSSNLNENLKSNDDININKVYVIIRAPYDSVYRHKFIRLNIK